MEKINLERITRCDTHSKILFQILKMRSANISHQSLPTYAEHKRFVLNHPYRIWYLIKYGNEYIGNAYILKNNCVGITIVKNIRTIMPIVLEMLLKKHKPLKAIKSVRGAGFCFNTSPNNQEYISILKKMGATIIQTSYAFND
jgi:hypothetical protein